jgi:hypothetical protein
MCRHHPARDAQKPGGSGVGAADACTQHRDARTSEDQELEKGRFLSQRYLETSTAIFRIRIVKLIPNHMTQPHILWFPLQNAKAIEQHTKTYPPATATGSEGQPPDLILSLRKAFASRHVRGLLSCLAINAALCLCLQSCVTPGLRPRGATIPLQDVVDQVSVALDQFKSTPAAQYAELSEADFTFQVVETKKGGIDVNPYILSFGVSFSREVTHTVTFAYDNKKPSKQRRLTNKKETELSAAFTDLINNAYRAAEKTLTAGGLPLDHADLTVEFAVTWAGTAGIQAPVATLITLGAHASASRNDVQTVKLTFTRK